MQYQLVKLRKEHKLSQVKMAEYLGIHQETYSRKERGEIQFKLDEMFQISKLFDLPLEQIFLPSDFEILEAYNNRLSK